MIFSNAFIGFRRGLGTAGVTALLAGALFAFTPTAEAEDNDTCIGCHKTQGLATQFPSSEKLPLTIDIVSMNSSVHGSQNCTTCHENIREFPHPENTARDYREFQLENSKRCEKCHEEQAEQGLDGNHAHALANGNTNAAVCTDCHGSHAVGKPDFPRHQMSTNCGRCHGTIYALYAGSAHGQALLEGENPDVPVCTDCHESHNQEDPTTQAFRLKSPKICAACHADETLMRKYNIAVDVFDTYVADFHGLTVTLFDKQHPDQPVNAAVCTDCHGVHDIQRVTDANSSVIKQNLLVTCRKCHPEASLNFPDSWLGHFPPSRDRYPLVYWVNVFYGYLIPITIGGMVVFVLIDAGGRIIRRLRRGVTGTEAERLSVSEEEKARQADPKIPPRFTVPQRIEHFFLAVSFTVLGITGLVQRFGLNPLSEHLINQMGGIEMTRVIHRAAAVVFAILSVYHVIPVGHKFFVRRVRMTMRPVLKDLADGMHWILYSLFLRRNPPQMPRYTFAEKLEYWALIWGGIVMIATGFMLWNPLITTQFLPGQFIPAAKAAHGGEAVLAVLAIIVWHFYNVHIKMFNKSMFTGKLTHHQMEEEHGEEWNEILAGHMDAAQPPEEMHRRQLFFIPAAVIIAAIGIGGIYWAATAENTAISTVPVPMSRSDIYSPTAALPKESPRTENIAAPLIPHPVTGQEQCDACHSRSGFKPLPSDHEGRPVESCRICHSPGPLSDWRIAAADRNKQEEDGLQPPPHPTTGPYEDCLICHGIGKIKPFPDYHANTKVENCTICHK